MERALGFMFHVQDSSGIQTFWQKKANFETTMTLLIISDGIGA
jgi:hypothetical protein